MLKFTALLLGDFNKEIKGFGDIPDDTYWNELRNNVQNLSKQVSK